MESGSAAVEAESTSVRQLVVAAAVTGGLALAGFGLLVAIGDPGDVRALAESPAMTTPPVTVAGARIEREAPGVGGSTGDDASAPGTDGDSILGEEPLVSSSSTVYDGPPYGPATTTAVTIGPPATTPPPIRSGPAV